MSILIFYITHPDETTARHISEKMVQQKLAACANIFLMQSSFFWEDALQSENEWVSILKTVPELETQLEAALKKNIPTKFRASFGGKCGQIWNMKIGFGRKLW